jgi:hypothetical protein
MPEGRARARGRSEAKSIDDAEHSGMLERVMADGRRAARRPGSSAHTRREHARAELSVETAADHVRQVGVSERRTMRPATRTGQ